MLLALRYNILSMLARPTSTGSSVLLIAFIIGAFCYLQAVTDSALNTLNGHGSATTILILNQSAETEGVSGLGQDAINKLELTPNIKTADGKPIISRELVAIGSAFTKADPDVAINTAIRGVEFEAARAVRPKGVSLVEGREPQPGTLEVMVGLSSHRLYRNHDVGDSIQLGNRGTREFKVVGVFSTGGSAEESEIWGYVETLRDVYGRGGYSSARVTVPDESAAREAIEYIEGPSVSLTAMTEAEYFSDLNANTTATQVLSIAMIIIMGTAAIFAIANTMYAAVVGRTREIGMLRAIGFGRLRVLTAFVAEGLALSLIGGVLGAIASLSFNGMQRTILPNTFTTVSYSLQITPKIIGTSLAIALLIGLIGSIMPAYRAARMSVVRSLREP
jgi:putative ABC transport system permease protein